MEITFSQFLNMIDNKFIIECDKTSTGVDIRLMPDEFCYHISLHIDESEFEEYDPIHIYFSEEEYELEYDWDEWYYNNFDACEKNLLYLLKKNFNNVKLEKN